MYPTLLRTGASRHHTSSSALQDSMGEEVAEWSTMWGAKVKMPNDMPDDILKDAITFTRKMLDQHPDFENDGEC